MLLFLSQLNGTVRIKTNFHLLERRSGLLGTVASTTTTTPSTLLVPVVEAAMTREVISCPESRGMFPYHGDCTKYIYCLKNRPQVQLCYEGTLFSPVTRQCEAAQNVTCPATESSGTGRSAHARKIDSGFDEHYYY